MRHLVLTRSSYGPEWARDRNERRFALSQAVTARLMAQQTAQEWTWVVLLDERDPLLRERLGLFDAAAPHFEPIIWAPDEVGTIAGDKFDRWRTDDASDTILTTRLDDDDGFPPDLLERVQAAAVGLTERTVLLHPNGYRVWNGLQADVYHDCNAMHTMVSPPGDTFDSMSYGHRQAREQGAWLFVDQRPGWLWVRHRDTRSEEAMSGDRPITDELRRLFPIDWPALEAAWRG